MEGGPIVSLPLPPFRIPFLFSSLFLLNFLFPFRHLIWGTWPWAPVYVPLFTSSSRHDVNMFTFFISFSVFDHSILSHVPLVATPLSTSFCDHDKLCSLFFNFIFPFRLSIGAHAPPPCPLPRSHASVYVIMSSWLFVSFSPFFTIRLENARPLCIPSVCCS